MFTYTDIDIPHTLTNSLSALVDSHRFQVLCKCVNVTAEIHEIRGMIAGLYFSLNMLLFWPKIGNKP